MLAKIDLLCAERDRLKRAESRKPSRSWQAKNAEPTSAPVRSNPDGAPVTGAAIVVAIDALAKRRTYKTTTPSRLSD
jgi:hypothetical protein